MLFVNTQRHVVCITVHARAILFPKIFQTNLGQRNISISRFPFQKMVDKAVKSESQFVKEEEIACGKWLAFNKITYKDPQGKERTWEVVRRTDKQSGTDAVCVIAILKRLLKYDCLVLVKQYRPPMKCSTIEFPAGLIDESESADNCALRELKEETGFTGTIKHQSPATCIDPGVGGTTCHLLTAEIVLTYIKDLHVIDGDLDCNIHPKSDQQESEFIEILCIPMEELLGKLNDYSKQGLIVNSMVYSYAIAMEQTKNIKNKASI